jgi:glucose-6-phosphate isomerase
MHNIFSVNPSRNKIDSDRFIGFVNLCMEKNHHDKLMSNFFAQTEALLHGKSAEKLKQNLKNKV